MNKPYIHTARILYTTAVYYPEKGGHYCAKLKQRSRFSAYRHEIVEKGFCDQYNEMPTQYKGYAYTNIRILTSVMTQGHAKCIKQNLISAEFSVSC